MLVYSEVYLHTLCIFTSGCVYIALYVSSMARYDMLFFSAVNMHLRRGTLMHY